MLTTTDASAMPIANRQSGCADASYPLKRILDVIISALMLLLLTPILFIVAVAIKVASPGPVFYRQKRLGLREQPFTILKFRTMRVDADKVGPAFTVGNDPRVTKLGKMLRRTSVDELPQLWNVLKGDMSLLGPRPYAGFELETWTREQRLLRASVRPGISGLSQSTGRSAMTVEQIIRSDLEYVSRCGFVLDCQIVLRTIRTVLSTRGTN